MTGWGRVEKPAGKAGWHPSTVCLACPPPFVTLVCFACPPFPPLPSPSRQGHHYVRLHVTACEDGICTALLILHKQGVAFSVGTRQAGRQAAWEGHV